MSGNATSSHSTYSFTTGAATMPIVQIVRHTSIEKTYLDNTLNACTGPRSPTALRTHPRINIGSDMRFLRFRTVAARNVVLLPRGAYADTVTRNSQDPVAGIQEWNMWGSITRRITTRTSILRHG